MIKSLEQWKIANSKHKILIGRYSSIKTNINIDVLFKYTKIQEKKYIKKGK